MTKAVWSITIRIDIITVLRLEVIASVIDVITLATVHLEK